MKRWIFAFIFTLALNCPAQTPAPAPTAPPLPPDLEAVHDIEMGKGGGKILHAEVVQPKAADKRLGRAVIYVHGGGWMAGTNKYDISRVYFLAQHGYLVTSIEYRLSLEAKWPAQIEDCKLAVRWLRANAARYQISPDRIGVYGHSAGGHLTACMGTMDDLKFEGTGGFEGVSSRVQAVVDTAGPVDFREGNFYAGSTYIPDTQIPKDDGMLLTLLGKSFAAAPELWKEASPITHIHSGIPPFFIAHGEMDPIVSPVQAQNFAADLRKAGVPTELTLIQNANHGLGTIPGGVPASPDGTTFRAMVLAFFDKYLK
jgi:acetyl esterase/lipase